MSVYVSEFNAFSAYGGDFAEVVAPAGTDISGYSLYVYNNDGTIYSGPWTFGTPITTEHGLDVYLFDAVDGFSLSADDGIALIDDSGTVLQFLSNQGQNFTATEGPATGESSTPTGSWGSGVSQETSDGGATYSATTTQSRGAIPCFAKGTLIETLRGDAPVETLRPGDTVLTFEGLFAEILWVSKSAQRDARNGGRAVRIARGAFGHNRPSQDLVVSENHRICMDGASVLGTFCKGASLVPAKALVGLPGVAMQACDPSRVWHHFACAAHHLLSVHGCVTESLLLGPMVLQRMPRPRRLQLQKMTGANGSERGALNGPPAARCLTPRETQQRLLSASQAARKGSGRPNIASGLNVSLIS